MNSKTAKQIRNKVNKIFLEKRDKVIQNTSVLVVKNLCGQRLRRRFAIAWCILRGKDIKILLKYLFK